MKDVKGYEGYYKVSADGAIISTARQRPDGRIYKEKVLSPGKGSAGYLNVTLCKNKVMKCINIHRIVAKNYLPNPENLPEVNHIDGDKHNNAISNLEWCTSQHNIRHGISNGLRTVSDHSRKVSSENGKKRRRPVACYDIHTDELVSAFISIKEAVDQKYATQDTKVTEVCKGRRNTHNHYKWRYINGN